jgi:hypothetical protein
MRIQLSMLLVCCAILGIVGFALINPQTSRAFAALPVPYHMIVGHPLLQGINRVTNSDDTATILTSASTNTCASTINVYVTGIATYKNCISQGQVTLANSVSASFFRDIDLAQPLNTLPKVACFKSSSFGVRIYVSTGGKKSPDISCASGSLEENLANDVQTIKDILRAKSM